VNSINLNPDSLQAVIFDLDGTLVDTLGDFVAVLQGMLASMPTPYCDYVVERPAVEKMVGKGSENLIKSVLSLVEPAQTAIKSEAMYELAWESYQLHYTFINGQYSSVFDGVVAGLTQLQSHGLPMACVTNKPTAFALDLLQRKGLFDYFALVVGGDAVAHKKPDPLPLLQACERLGSSPPRTLMVGDSSNDAQAARAAGCPVLLVTYGYNHGLPVRGVDADAYTESLARIPWHA